MGRGTSKAGGGNAGAAPVEEFKYVRDPSIKPWSDAEERRTRETSDMIVRLDNAGEDGEFQEYYSPDTYEEIETIPLGSDYGTRNGVEAVIARQQYNYVHNWDENDNRVRRGGKVTGTVHYTVAIDGDYLNDSQLGYKTLADARHALALELDWLRQRESYNARRAK